MTPVEVCAIENALHSSERWRVRCSEILIVVVVVRVTLVLPAPTIVSIVSAVILIIASCRSLHILLLSHRLDGYLALFYDLVCKVGKLEACDSAFRVHAAFLDRA